MNSFLDFLLAQVDPGDPRKGLDPNAPGASRENAVALPRITATAQGTPRPVPAFSSSEDRQGTFMGENPLVGQIREMIRRQETSPAAASPAAPERRNRTFASDALRTPPISTEPMPPRVIANLQKPFVRDTLWSLVGGPPRSVLYQDAAPDVDDGLGSVLAEYRPRNDQMRLYGTMYHGFPPLNNDVRREDTISHEAGHMLDFRGLAPDLVRRVKASYPIQRRNDPAGDDYASSSPDELFAEDFSRALDYVRDAGIYAGTGADESYPTANDYRNAVTSPEGDLTPTEGMWPVVQWLLARPEFRNNPLNRPENRLPRFGSGIERMNAPFPSPPIIPDIPR